MTLTDSMMAHARSLGPIRRGDFRVVVLESELRWLHHDFASLDEAKQHANDAASEPDDNPPIATVFDAGFSLVHEGRHYAAG